MKYKIGQILTSKVETIIEKELSGDKVTISKGNKIIIGADNFVHYITNDFIQPLSKDSEVKGYDADGIAEYLYMRLSKRFMIDEMLEDYDRTKENFIEEIKFSLEEIGF